MAWLEILWWSFAFSQSRVSVFDRYSSGMKACSSHHHHLASFFANNDLFGYWPRFAWKAELDPSKSVNLYLSSLNSFGVSVSNYRQTSTCSRSYRSSSRWISSGTSLSQLHCGHNGKESHFPWSSVLHRLSFSNCCWECQPSRPPRPREPFMAQKRLEVALKLWTLSHPLVDQTSL